MTFFWGGFILLLVLLVMTGIAILASAYARTIRSSHTRLASLGSHLLETDSGMIEYARVGNGYPVLVVHGAMGGFDHGLWVAQGFKVSDYQLISISRFGYLRSAVPPGASLNLQADAFAQLLDEIGIQKVVVFAISAGSTSAIRFTARYPERVAALVLVGPDSPGKEQMPMPPRIVFETILRSDFLFWVLFTFFETWMQNSMGLAPKGFPITTENRALIKQFLAGAMPISKRMNGLIYDSYLAVNEFNESVMESSPYPLGAIKVPVLVVHALDDPLAIAENVQALAELFPHMRRCAIPDGGHFFFGHMEEVTTEIQQFIRSHLEE